MGALAHTEEIAHRIISYQNLKMVGLLQEDEK